MRHSERITCVVLQSNSLQLYLKFMRGARGVSSRVATQQASAVVFALGEMESP